MSNEALKDEWAWAHPVSDEGSSPWFDEVVADLRSKRSASPHNPIISIAHEGRWIPQLRQSDHQANTLRALADLPVQLTPQQLRTAADLLETWTGTLPELLTTISEITAPRQVAE